MADFWFFHDFIFTNRSAKAHTLQWVVGFFEGLNFTNDQHPQNSWNLRTSKKTNYTVLPMLHGSTIKACLFLVLFNIVSLHYT